MDKELIYNNINKINEKSIISFAALNRINVNFYEAQEMISFCRAHVDEINDIEDIRPLIYTYYNEPFARKFYYLICLLLEKTKK